MLLMFYLLFTGPQGSEGCTLENHRETEEITAYTGESVLLPCYCTDTNSTPETFTWKKDLINRKEWRKVSNESGQYSNRYQLFNSHSPGNLSLLISHLTEEDRGVYRCNYKGAKHTDITLTVKGCTLEGQGQNKKITAYTGGSVLLSCNCTDTNSTPVIFKWKKENKTGTQKRVVSNESGQFKGRVQLFNSHSPGNLSLLVSHLTKDDGGEYRCNASGRGFGKIRLSVEDNTPQPTSSESTTGDHSRGDSDSSVNYIYICAAVGASLLLIVLGGVFYWRYRAQRRGRTESQTGSRGGQETQDDALVLYATVNKQDTHQEEQEQDDVTYSTVVHNKPSTSAHTLLDTGDTTEYACVKRS
ncbi:polymeric immunoglobulin receptor-like [Hoplias malabaricus]|uniref:polymeric immunoglobulin receptor-like n=1 Tax=Hoplias malabaricus TaxID=27720 RepID=UPI003463373D